MLGSARSFRGSCRSRSGTFAMSQRRASPSPRRKIRTLRRRSSALAAVALLLAGCGGEEREPAAAPGVPAAGVPAPRLPAALAAELSERGDSISELLEGQDPCAARTEAETLQRRTIAAINARRVPPSFQEELTGRVNALVNSISCTASARRAAASEAGSRSARRLADWLRENS